MPKLKNKPATKHEKDWSKRPEGPLVLEVGLYGREAVYALSPRFDRWLEKAYPNSRRADRIVVGIPFETDHEFDAIHRPHWEAIALMLTGLTREQLREVGGILLVQPSSNKEWNVAIDSDCHQG